MAGDVGKEVQEGERNGEEEDFFRASLLRMSCSRNGRHRQGENMCL